MFSFLLALHVVVTVLLLLIILIQKSEGGSSLFSSGSGTSMFNARGTSNMLTKTTWALATIFLLNCILMAHISANKVKSASSIITGTPHASRPLSNKAISDLNKNKDKENINIEDNSKKSKTNKKSNTNNKESGKNETKQSESSKQNNDKHQQSTKDQKPDKDSSESSKKE